LHEAINQNLGYLLRFNYLPSASAFAAQIEYPQTRYEAVDQKTCDSFVIFSEREKIFYGSDAKLFPGARFVEVTHITPTVGSITPALVEIKTVANPVADYVHLTGNVRFRNGGMLLKSSNFPPGSGMTS
jgi:hypothetical protein